MHELSRVPVGTVCMHKMNITLNFEPGVDHMYTPHCMPRSIENNACMEGAGGDREQFVIYYVNRSTHGACTVKRHVHIGNYGCTSLELVPSMFSGNRTIIILCPF